ncbi:hypothetical protein OKW26_001575 [Paraburkholderia sp. 32]
MEVVLSENYLIAISYAFKNLLARVARTRAWQG